MSLLPLPEPASNYLDPTGQADWYTTQQMQVYGQQCREAALREAALQVEQHKETQSLTTALNQKVKLSEWEELVADNERKDAEIERLTAQCEGWRQGQKEDLALQVEQHKEIQRLTAERDAALADSKYNGHGARHWNSIAVDRFKEIQNLEAKLTALASQTPIAYWEVYQPTGELIWEENCVSSDPDEHEHCIPIYAAAGAAPVPEGWQLVPVETTQDQLNAARDWSIKKYGMGIGNDAATGCYKAMLAAAKELK